MNADSAVRGGPRTVFPRSPSSLPVRHLLSEVHLAKSLFHQGSCSHTSGTLGPGLKDLGLLTAPAAPPHHLLLHSTAAGGPVPARSSSPWPLGHPLAVRARAPEAWRESHQSSESLERSLYGGARQGARQRGAGSCTSVATLSPDDRVPEPQDAAPEKGRRREPWGDCVLGRVAMLLRGVLPGRTPYDRTPRTSPAGAL